MKAKSFRLGEVEINSIAIIRARLGFKTDIDAIRYALAAAIALQGGTVPENAVLRTAQVEVAARKIVADPAGKEARVVADAFDEAAQSVLTEKERIIDKMGGPFQMCQKHGSFYSTCWSLHR